MKIQIDRNGKTIPTDDSWQFGIGNDHAGQMLRADVCEHVKLAHDELGIRYIRFHGIFDDDLLVVQRLTDYFNFAAMPWAGKVQELSFRQIANVFDNVLKCGMKPFVELSFMPSAIAKGKKVGLRYRNHIDMPKHMARWCDLVEKFIRFLLERYGKEEVESWYFEVWNEPDLPIFFHGKQQDYFELYAATARTIKKVDAALRVGGPSTSACRWVGAFKSYCEKNDVPFDFLTTHHYPGDGFGNSFGVKDAFKMMKITHDNAKNGVDLGDTLTEYFFKPDIYKTWTKGILRKLDETARQKAGDTPLFMTEWNSMAVYSAPVHDEKYSAAFLVKSVMDLKGIMDAYMFWCCSDVFEELFILGKPFHDGSFSDTGITYQTRIVFGTTAQNLHNSFNFLISANNGIKFIFLCQRRHITAEFINDAVEYSVFVDGEKTQILLYAQDFDYAKHDTTELEITINTSARSVTKQVIDDNHCNPKAEWLKLGKPDLLTPAQVKMIKGSTRLVSEPQAFTAENGNTTIRLSVQTNDVVLLTLE